MCSKMILIMNVELLISDNYTTCTSLLYFNLRLNEPLIPQFGTLCALKSGILFCILQYNVLILITKTFWNLFSIGERV